MAPKKKQSQKGESKEKQMKLFSKEVAEEPMKVSKSKSKQFSADQQGEQKTAGTSQGRWSYGSGETPEKLLISSWNVNGIRSVINKQELQNYLTKYKPDVLCIGETKINEEAFDKEKISLQGYNGYWNFCKVSSGYSGVAIFSKYLPISVKEDLPKEEHSQEGRVLTMEFEKFYLVTAYIPNSGQKLKRLDYRMDYDTYFQAHCEKLRKVKPTIVCGDLNVCHRQIDIARPKGNEKTAGFTLEERKSFTDFLEKGWIDSYRKLNPETVKYSWWSMRTKGREKNIGWRLDYFLINEEAWGKIKDSKINNDVFGSDHCPIELEIDLSL